jgi:putative restriction endonuclease
MAGVFDISGQSKYDDAISDRYHFPNSYLATAQKLLGSWIVFRETRAAKGSMSYIATAFLDKIDIDPRDPTHSYARLSNFLVFDRPVPYFSAEGRFREAFLRQMEDRAAAGRMLRGRSIRELLGDDFCEIVSAGLTDTLNPDLGIRLGLEGPNLDDATRHILESPINERRIEQILLNRKIRDANFRNHVLSAYDDTCAVTGLRIINGGGKAEAQAAHIWPVADGGPDIVQNGIALSATAHWMFDRHLFTFDENLCLLVSHNKMPQEYLKLLPRAGEQIRLPRDRVNHPKMDYVRKHRERFAGLTC